MATALRLVVGLGNPGPAYAATRHNIGAAFVRRLAERFRVQLAPTAKFKAEAGRGWAAGVDLRLLLPGLYMNQSGQVVGPYARYHRIEPEQILVAYDEAAFAPGVARLKSGGGANGHKGVKSLIEHLGSRDFHRLRIGVGHPGDKAQMVRYLTEVPMPPNERELAAAALDLDEELLASLVRGELGKVMNRLHQPAALSEPTGV